MQVQLSQKGEDVRRRFEVLYLDERVRVAQFLTDEEDEPVFFVFKRVEEANSKEVLSNVSSFYRHCFNLS